MYIIYMIYMIYSGKIGEMGRSDLKMTASTSLKVAKILGAEKFYFNILFPATIKVMSPI